uniref:Protochlorophyllide reductase n=1 Tax=Chaetoceros debilis TaxID=122233 RepID=A0A7S3PUK1_9STRA
MAHLVLLLAKPLPFLFRNVNHVAKLLPQDRFVVSTSTDDSTKSCHLAIVTGSNTGIGLETATSLVEQGYEVILACRSRDKGQKAVDRINENNANAGNENSDSRTRTSIQGKAIFLHPLDLSSLNSVKSFSKAFTTQYGPSHPLHILVNNAGINSTGKSVDGMDLCFQTNFVGHYLLTRLMIPHLLKAKNTYSLPQQEQGDEDADAASTPVEAGRVVNLSSVTHHFANCNEVRHNVPPNATRKHDKTWWKHTALPNVSDNTYKESKLAALVFTHELNKRYGSQGLRAVSANPGSVNSDIWRDFPRHMQIIHNLIYLNSKQGAQTSIAGAVGKLPLNAVYLQPYWQPNTDGRDKDMRRSGSKTAFRRWFSVPVPFIEMLGVYCGFACTEPRLPTHINASASDLWDVCEELVGGVDNDVSMDEKI